ncbi:sugar-transfer associated ATP-grasp domain-containing protein [Bacteroides sp.]|uniref:sugar-transfer associated ATP-grasp domain-containing protein n=1 Tax=Bacteroides sp. TaxID=29523 RepID=UPI002588E9EF|nr:sugar-transfer associated ATP-grasp domain-containing protein [Bacteroides sp.]
MNILKKIKIKIRAQKRFLRESKNNRIGSLWNFIYGFYQETIDVCGITKDNYKDFLSDRDYLLKHPYNGCFTSIIDNKLWLPYLLNRYDKYVPEYYFFCDKGSFLDLKKEQRIPIDAVLSTLNEKNKMALKHTHSSLGAGFYLLEKNKEGYLLNHKPVAEEELRKFLITLNEYVFTEYIQQGSYANAIAPSSLNTIRLLTVWDVENNRFQVIRAFHRFGCSNSVVDNLGAGNGVLSYIDIKSGTLTGKGVITLNGVGKCSDDIIHPDSNIRLKGVQIPNFDKIVSEVIQISNSISFLKYIGWDIALTEDSFKIIEANSLTSLSTIQGVNGFHKDRIMENLLNQK